jgi:Fic family protein
VSLESLTTKKKLLDSFRPLPSALVQNLGNWFRIELTYTSNAIEGNTLTRRETALVVEKGITVGGKTLVEHLEATNHAEALDWVTEQIGRKPRTVEEGDILRMHQMILKGVDDANAGHYRSLPVRISGSAVTLPNPRKVPELMTDFVRWLRTVKELHPVNLAAEAHYRLVTIHPFVDGNGRTARLLMNLLLLMQGYPPAIIRTRDRLSYITALEKAQLGGTIGDYLKLMIVAAERSLDIYLKAISGETDESVDSDRLLKIGELAKLAGVNNSTIRHWTKEGILKVSETTKTGYQLYHSEELNTVKKILELKTQRWTLSEIRLKLDSE